MRNVSHDQRRSHPSLGIDMVGIGHRLGAYAGYSTPLRWCPGAFDVRWGTTEPGLTAAASVPGPSLLPTLHALAAVDDQLRERRTLTPQTRSRRPRASQPRSPRCQGPDLAPTAAQPTNPAGRTPPAQPSIGHSRSPEMHCARAGEGRSRGSAGTSRGENGDAAHLFAPISGPNR